MKHLELASINVINIKRVEAYLDTLMLGGQNGSPLIQRWIKSNLRNWLLRDNNPVRIHLTDRSQFSLLGIHAEPTWLAGKELPDNLWYVPMNPKLKGMIEASLHHISYMVTNGAKDISKVSVEDAITGGIARAESERQVLIDKHFESDGVKPIWRNNKYTMVSIIGRDGLQRESKYMGHCVGLGGHIEGYWGKIESNIDQIWSLRDTNNVPHCTIQYHVQDKSIRQIRSKGVMLIEQFNGLHVRYWPAMYEFLNSSECHALVKMILKSELDLNFKSKPAEAGWSPGVWEPHVHGYRFIKIRVKDGGDAHNPEHHEVHDA